MDSAIQVLMVEDSADDAELLTRSLRSAGNTEVLRVQTEDEMRAALDEREFHIILSDFQLPSFSAPAAFRVLRESGLDIPFIVVSGVVTMEDAVEMMRAGAHDFIRKEDRARLQPVIQREIHQAETRKHQREIEEALKQSRQHLVQSNNRFEMFARSASDWFWETDVGGSLTYLSERGMAALGARSAQWQGSSPGSLLALPENAAAINLYESAVREHRAFRDIRFLVKAKGTETLHMSWSGIPSFGEDGTFQGYRGTGSDITDQVITAEKARRATSLLADAITSAPQPFALFDDQYRLVVCNERYRQIYAPIAHLCQEGASLETIERAACDMEILDTSEYGNTNDYIRKRLTHIRMPMTAFVERFSDGRRMLVYEHSTSDGGVISFRLDITAVKQQEEQLREREAEILLLLNSTAEGIFGVDDNGCCTFCNASALKLLGYETAGEIIGRQMHDLIHHSTLDRRPLPAADCDLERGRQHGQRVHKRENVFWRKDGTHFFAEVWSHPIVRSGHVVGAVVTFLDATDRIEAQERLVQAQKMEAIGRITGGVAHDFNNLLTIMLGNLELAEAYAEPHRSAREVVQCLQKATKAVRSAAHVVDGLLAFARRKHLVPNHIDLNEAIRNMDPMLRQAAGDAIDLALALEENLPHANVDEVQLQNALLNLVINARDAITSQASGPGRILVQTEYSRDAGTSNVGENGPRGSQTAVVSVSDNGCGIPPDLLDKVLEPFFTTKQPGRGTGLGLSSVYGFVEQSGGNFVITSQVGAGTTVTLSFPGVMTGKLVDKDEEWGDSFLLRRRSVILLVEDREELRQTTAEMLRHIGFDILESSDGVEAMKVIEGPQSIDLLFTDIIMPGGISGLQLAEAATARRNNLRVLFTTGYTDENHGWETGRTVEYPWVRKPYSREQLLSAIKNAMSD